MKLIRHDIPSGLVSVNYDILERVSQETDYLPSVLGITTISNPNQSHPFTLTQVAQNIGLANWQAAQKILNKIKEDKNIDLKLTDNRYHCKIKTGTSDASVTRKWSHEAVDLLKKVGAAEPYEITMNT